jgi:ABC-type glycerol-3-phosphate transport system substrate-binding protein
LAYQYVAATVDWQTGGCDFETAEFLTILNTVDALKENPEPRDNADLDFTPTAKLLNQGSLIAYSMYIGNVNEMAEEEKLVGQDLSFIGRPTWDGRSGSYINLREPLGICSGGNQEGAWEFIKYVLTREEEILCGYYPLSFHKATMADTIAEAMNPSDSNNEPFMQPGDDEELYRFLEHTAYIGTASERIIEIIMEEAQAFLAGEKTAEETAHVIQSRVGILIAE